MRRPTLTLLLAMLLACGTTHADTMIYGEDVVVDTAQAAEWVPIPLTNPNKVVLIDTTSVSISGPVRRAWFKFVMPPHTTKGAASAGAYPRIDPFGSWH